MWFSRRRTAAWLIRLLARCGNSSQTSVSSCWGLSSALMTWCIDSLTHSSHWSTITSSTLASATYHRATLSAWGRPGGMWDRLPWRPASWLIKSLALGCLGNFWFRHCTWALRSLIQQTTYSWAASADGPCSRCTTVLTARYGCRSLKPSTLIWIDVSLFQHYWSQSNLLHRA